MMRTYLGTVGRAGKALAQRMVFFSVRIGRRQKAWLLQRCEQKWDALTQLRARLHRARLSRVTFIGITGSAGKTTTKELSLSILSTVGPCESNPRSANIPQATARTLLRTTPGHRYCVLEVSGNAPGRVDPHLAMIKPDIAVLTLVASDHSDNFSSLDDIAVEKEKLITALGPEGTAVLNIDDPRVRAIGECCRSRVFWVGEASGATLRLLRVTSVYPDPLILEFEYKQSRYELKTQLYGTHLAMSVLSALGIALAAGVSLPAAMAAVASAQPLEGRMQVVASKDGPTFLRDDWKAPYWSFDGPFAFMGEARAQRKVLIIGTVSYTQSASEAYETIARRALEVADLVVFVGPQALRAIPVRPQAGPRQLLAFPDMREAALFLQSELRPGDLVLLKGSNKADHLVRLLLNREKAVECWRQECGLRLFCDRCPRLYQKGTNPIPPIREPLINS